MAVNLGIAVWKVAPVCRVKVGWSLVVIVRILVGFFGFRFFLEQWGRGRYFGDPCSCKGMIAVEFAHE